MASGQRGWSEAGCDCNRRAMPRLCGRHGRPLEAPLVRAQWTTRPEQVFVQAFLAHAPVEALYQTVLHGLAWGNVVPVDPRLLAPSEHRHAGQFGAIARREGALF